MKLKEMLERNLKNFNFYYRMKKVYFQKGFEINGNEEEIEKFLDSYFKEKGIDLITVDVSKEESRKFYYDDMAKVIEKGTPFALYLKNYLVADIRTRYIWASIYKDRIHCTRTGTAYTDKVYCVTTIIIDDKSYTNVNKLDNSESSMFIKIDL